MEAIDIYLWDFVLYGLFFPTHFSNNEVVNKSAICGPQMKSEKGK